MLRQVSGPRVFLCALAFRMADQPKEDESQDNVGTGAEISAENDAPAHFYDVPVEDESQANAGTGAALSTDNDVQANSYDGPDGAPQSAPAVALDSPSAAHDRRPSALFSLRADTSLTAAAATPTVAGAEAAAAKLEREIYLSELAQQTTVD